MSQLDDIRAHLAMLRCDLDSPDVRHLRRLVDHVLPCASFDLTDVDQQRRCFAWHNLQPLTKAANKQKGAHV